MKKRRQIILSFLFLLCVNVFAEPKKIAILPLGTNKDYTQQGKDDARGIFGALKDAIKRECGDVLTLVTRYDADIERLMREKEFQQKSVTEQVKAINKIANVDYLVMGELSEIGGYYNLQESIVDLSANDIASGFVENIRKGDSIAFNNAATEIAEKLITVPQPQGNLTINQNANSITIEWNRATDNNGAFLRKLEYKVVYSTRKSDLDDPYFAEQDGKKGTEWKLNAKEATFTVPDESVTYYYTVLVRNPFGKQSMYEVKSSSGTVVKNAQRGKKNEASFSGGIGIHIETGVAGTLFMYDSNEWKELADLWDNDTYDIPIERPAIYKIKIRYPDGAELTRDVNINSRGIYNVLFTMPPENCKVESVTGTTALISWTFEEGMDEYSVKYYPTDNPRSFNTVHTKSGSGASSIKITGLNVGTEYTFEIESGEEYSNSYGKLYSSKPTIIKGYTSLLKVKSITVDKVSSNKASIKFDIAEEDSNTKHIWYYSKSADFSSAKIINSNNYPSEHIDEIVGLTPNSTYYFWLKLSENNKEGKVSQRLKVETTKYEYSADEVFVESGSFTMGSSDGDSDERPTHNVYGSSFRMCKHEVTQADYEAVMGTNPSTFKGENRPVEFVSWYDAIEFCNKLSERQGLKPCYKKNGSSYICDWTSNGYRLPTEAEWEYAARGGNKTKGYKCSGSDNANIVAWYYGNSGSTTHDVMTKQANELGLYDMSGNVWEWCWDWYSNSYYNNSPSDNPHGASLGSYRVFRGGSWDDDASFCRVANRYYNSPVIAGVFLGFRVVRSSSN
jgi:formylglycine-generating enzyme required for sulfatase activity